MKWAVRFLMVLWVSGFVGAGMGLDARDPENKQGFIHIAAAATWPIWVPGLAVFHVVSTNSAVAP